MPIARACPFIEIEELVDKRVAIDAAVAQTQGGIGVHIDIIDNARSDGFGIIFRGQQAAFAQSEIGQVAIDVACDFLDVAVGY